MSDNHSAPQKHQKSSKPVDLASPIELAEGQTESSLELGLGWGEVLPGIQRRPDKNSGEIKSRTENLNPGNILALQRVIGNQAVTRLLSKGEKETKPVSGSVIQRFIANDTYVEDASNDFIQVIEAAENPEGFYIVTDKKTGKRRIIKHGSTQYRHLMQASNLKDAYDITRVLKEVYQVKRFGGEQAGEELAYEPDLKKHRHLNWVMTTAKNNVAKARELLIFLNTFSEESLEELAKEQLTATNLDVAIARERVAFLAPYLAKGAEQYQLAREQLAKANGGVATAKVCTDFLIPYLKDPEQLNLAEEQLKITNLDVPLAQGRTVYLLKFYKEDPQHYKIALDQLNKASPDFAKAETWARFLIEFFVAGYFDLADQQLTAAKMDVDRARKFVVFLIPYLAQGKKIYEIAEREITAADGDDKTALTRMNSFSDLFKWSEESANETADEILKNAKAAAKETEKQTIEEAQKAPGLKIPSKPKKYSKSNPKPKKLVEYESKVEAAGKLKKEEIEQAEQAREGNKGVALDKNLDFVKDMTADDFSGEATTELLKLSGNKKDAVPDLRKMMLAQPDPKDLTLAKGIFDSKQNVRQMATICERLLKKGLPPGNIITVAEFNLGVKHQPAIDWLETYALTNSLSKVEDKAEYLSKFPKAVAQALEAVQTVNEKDLYDLEPILADTPAAVSWLITFYGQPFYGQFVYYFTSVKPVFSKVKAVFDYNAAHQNFSRTKVFEWVNSVNKDVDKILAALTLQDGNNWETTTKLLSLMLSWDVTLASSTQYTKLVRLQAIAETGVLAMTVYQNDVYYYGSHNPPSRTGFVEYNFANGDRAEIHTHWNINDKKLVSMHIQDGTVNGTEINTWNYFKKVQEAIRNAHNATVGGVYAPTTNPVGGSLKL